MCVKCLSVEGAASSLTDCPETKTTSARPSNEKWVPMPRRTSPEDWQLLEMCSGTAAPLPQSAHWMTKSPCVSNSLSAKRELCAPKLFRNVEEVFQTQNWLTYAMDQQPPTCLRTTLPNTLQHFGTPRLPSARETKTEAVGGTDHEQSHTTGEQPYC